MPSFFGGKEVQKKEFLRGLGKRAKRQTRE